MKKLTAALTIALGLTLLQQPTFADNGSSQARSEQGSTVKEDGSASDAPGSAVSQGGNVHRDGNGKADGIYFPIRAASLQTTRGTGAITYHGGPILQQPKVYKIYYGTWSDPCGSTDTSTAGVVNNLLSNIGSSAWYKTNTSYYSITPVTLAKNYSTTSLTIADCVNVSAQSGTSLDYSLGSMVSDVVLNQISAKSWTPTANDIYFVFTSADVNVSGFKTAFCGWHSYLTTASTSVQFSFVGDSGASTSCTDTNIMSKSPNSNPSADAMVSVIAHELVETVSDPLLNAWYDSTPKGGYENADKCAWYFGTPTTNPTNTFSAANGARANSVAGTYNFYLQENAPANTQTCVSVNPSQLSTFSGFSPASGITSSNVTITGTGFSGAQVFFNGVAGTVSASSGTSLTVKVPSSATTGPITVVTDYGVWVSPTNFNVTLPALSTISSITPSTGRIGTPISINGSNFTGATAVKIGTVSITGFTVVSDSLITATIPTTAKTGNITVAGPGGTSTGVSFTVAAPVVSSFTPSNSLASTAITITGSNFTGATGAKIGTVALTGFSVVNDTQINATIPTSATTATISVTSAAGTGTSTGLFVKGLPTITSFTPASITIASATNSVTITGTNLLGSTSVTLTPTVGTPVVVTGLTNVTATKATFLCPKTLPLTTYKIQITTPAGTSAQAASSLTIK